MGFVSFLLHYNARNLVLEMLKHDKNCRTICISVASTPNSGELGTAVYWTEFVIKRYRKVLFTYLATACDAGGEVVWRVERVWV